MTDRRPAQATTLKKIADVLGLSVEQLCEGTEPQEMWAARECMRLWYRLKTDAGRDAALDALRKVLDDEGA